MKVIIQCHEECRKAEPPPHVKDQIEDKTKMSSSAMPTGLLVTLTKAEILDLVAYLRSARK